MKKSIVVDYLKEDAEVVESQEYGENLMTVWEGISLPPQRVAVISGPNFESFISNESINSFQLALKLLRPSLNDEIFIKTFRKLTPLLRVPILENLPYLKDLASQISMPNIKDDRFELCVENLTDGLVERFSIGLLDYDVEIKVIGAGTKFRML